MKELFHAVRAAVGFANQVIAIGEYTGPLSTSNRAATIEQLERDLEAMRLFVARLKARE